MFSCKDSQACLDGKDIVGLVLLASHEKAEFPHAFRAATGNRLALGDLASSSAVAVLLVELLFASLTLTLQTLDNIDSTTNVGIVVVFDLVSGLLSLVAHCTATRKRLGVSESRATSQVEVDLAAARRSKRGGDGLPHRSWGLGLSRGLTVKQRLG